MFSHDKHSNISMDELEAMTYVIPTGDSRPMLCSKKVCKPSSDMLLKLVIMVIIIMSRKEFYKPLIIS